MIFYYYQITNIQTNKKYIGITEKEPNERFNQHKKLLEKNKHFNYILQEDWLKYGKDNFTFEVIEKLECETIELGYEHEYFLISSNQINSYNLAPGGRVNPMYSEKVKEKMIKTKQSAVPNIYQLEEIDENVFKIINIFNSQKEVQRKLGFSQGNIWRGLKNHTKVNGYYWVSEDNIETFENDWKPYRTKFRPTAQLDEEGKIIKVHHNARVFEIEYNLRDSAVSHSVRQNSKCRGKIFKYIDESLYYKLKPIKLVF